jgi:High potential iron-sulfur protein
MTDDASNIRRSELSRRSMLRNFAYTAGGTAMLGKIIGENRMAVAQTKVAQATVAYQPTPHEGQACDTCLQFVPPAACKVVEGTISPAGWCKLYVKKPA